MVQLKGAPALPLKVVSRVDARLSRPSHFSLQTTSIAIRPDLIFSSTVNCHAQYVKRLEHAFINSMHGDCDVLGFCIRKTL